MGLVLQWKSLLELNRYQRFRRPICKGVRHKSCGSIFSEIKSDDLTKYMYMARVFILQEPERATLTLRVVCPFSLFTLDLGKIVSVFSKIGRASTQNSEEVHFLSARLKHAQD